VNRTVEAPAHPPRVRTGACVSLGLAGLVALLAGLASTVGLGRAAWCVALGCAAVLAALVVRGLADAGDDAMGPADVVTLGRALMSCAVAALTVELLLRYEVRPVLVGLTVPALVLDAVDGRVARRTGTVSEFGGRFDGEVDAFLILVLSVAAAPTVGWWVLAAGVVRYAFAAAGRLLPWLREPLEFRYWRKVVTAVVGIVLTVVVADLLPREVAVGLALVALALLAESFGRDVWWLWRRRPRGHAVHPEPRPRRAGVTPAATLLAGALVWFALVAPARPDRLTPGAFLRIPVEALVLVVAALALSGRSTRAVTTGVGVVLGAVALLKVLDLGAFTVLDRPFNLVTDRGELESGLGFVNDALGPWAAAGAVVGALALVGAAVVCLPWAVRRLARVVTRHRRQSVRAVVALAVVWAACAALGLQASPGEPVAAADAGPFVVGKVQAATAAYRDEATFARAMAADAFADPASGDLALLSGKDVVVAFVESYGRVALQGPGSGAVRRLLDARGARLDALGYSSASGWLGSPTFGGSSWLAHSTLQSGLTVSDQSRYGRLLTSTRTTLTSAFGRAGWRTVAVLPSTRGTWPEGREFYRFDQVYGRSSLGYAGPKFGFSAMPDQFTLAAFEQRELVARPRPPVMAELELTSSHGPWAPLPTTVDPAALGDGSVYDAIEADAVTAPQLWSDRSAVPAAYRTSIAYSLTSLLAFVERRHDDDLVVVMLGDHQPSTIVSGSGGNRDVPITVIARDPRVVRQLSGWGWQAGLRPSDTGPVWPMAAFRDRFLTTFSSASSVGTVPASTTVRARAR
jgi:phosphatidylglycerophosphate synthase